jgi:hypothetical protein
MMREDATSEVLRAIQDKFPCRERLGFEEVVSRSWASATFVGARHEIILTLDGEGAEAAAESFLGGLAAEEFPLRGHIMADIALVSVRRTPGHARIAIEALTVEDAQSLPRRNVRFSGNFVPFRAPGR